jgi:hypothetical protein
LRKSTLQKLILKEEKLIEQRYHRFFLFSWLMRGKPNKRAEQWNSGKKRTGGVIKIKNKTKNKPKSETKGQTKNKGKKEWKQQ